MDGCLLPWRRALSDVHVSYGFALRDPCEIHAAVACWFVRNDCNVTNTFDLGRVDEGPVGQEETP